MSLIQEIRAEIADNWPAFVYMGMMIVFSLYFFRERRSEARMVRQIGESVQEDMRHRFDELERLLRKRDQENV